MAGGFRLTRKEFLEKLSVADCCKRETGHSTPKLTKYSEIAKVLAIDVRDMGLDNDLNLDRIGDRIKYARLLRGYVDRAFAYEHGFAIQTVKSWESPYHQRVTAYLRKNCPCFKKIPFPFFNIENDPHKISRSK